MIAGHARQDYYWIAPTYSSRGISGFYWLINLAGIGAKLKSNFKTHYARPCYSLSRNF
jgi:hypothetical protein